MEEASSIIKAIEKGWSSAGQPKEFTIKIFEEPQKNFIGMTTKPAKIGIFFTELQPKPEPRYKRAKPAIEPAPLKPKEPRRVQQRPTKTREPVREPRAEVETKTEERGPVWTEEMIASVKDWLTQMLALMGLGKASFTLVPERFYLKIQFSSNLYDDKNRQKHLFATLSNLLLTMLKRHYKRPLKGYKIVLTGD